MQELPYAAHKKSPDLMILLKIDYKTMVSHIKSRGRSYEQIENDKSLEDYYKSLISYYDSWEKDYIDKDISPLMTIDCNKYDFANSEDDKNKVVHLIKEKLKEYR